MIRLINSFSWPGYENKDKYSNQREYNSCNNFIMPIESLTENKLI